MDPIATIGQVYHLFNQIRTIANEVKANHAQCALLMQRIRAIETAVHELDRLEKLEQRVEHSQAFKTGLFLLKQTLDRSLKLLQQFTQAHWFKRILHRGAHDSAFQAITAQLQACEADLQLGLSVQQLLNQQADHTAYEADARALQNNQAEILALNQHEMGVLASLQGHVRGFAAEQLARNDHDRLVQKQLEQLRIAIERFPPVPATPTSPRLFSKPPTSPITPRSPELPQIVSSIAWFELELGEDFVEGSSGALYQGTWQQQTVAIKITAQRHTSRQRQQLLRELSTAERLRHRHLTLLYGACVDDEHVALVLEYMENGSLSDTLRQARPLSLSTKRQIAQDVLQGLLYLHAQGLHYPQLAPQHILLDQYDRAKLTDFWLSSASLATLQSSVNREKLAWLAPEELIDLTQTDCAADVYRFGLLLWTLLHDRLPFEGLSQQAINHRLTQRPDTPEACSQTLPTEYCRLIQSCWHRNPDQRPSLSAIAGTLSGLPVEEHPTAANHYAMAQYHAKKQHYDAALSSYKLAAEQGESKAWRYIGTFYRKGIGTEPNWWKAYTAFLRGAEENAPHAMHELAVMLETGEGTEAGVPKNKHQALYWYTRAGNLGHAPAAEAARVLTERWQPNNRAAALSMR